MRQIAALLSLLMALSANAAEMWRWKDADGIVHYSDRPVQGAERIDVLSKQKSAGQGPAPAAPIAPLEPADPAPPPVARYTRCVVTSPTQDQVLINVSSVTLSIAVEPVLQPEHHLQVLLNGRPDTEWPPGAMSRTLANAYRGSYTLAVRVLDASGRSQCEGPTVTFYIRQPSLLAPTRKPPAKKP